MSVRRIIVDEAIDKLEDLRARPYETELDAATYDALLEELHPFERLQRAGDTREHVMFCFRGPLAHHCVVARRGE